MRDGFLDASPGLDPAGHSQVVYVWEIRGTRRRLAVADVRHRLRRGEARRVGRQAVLHAREWITAATAQYLVSWLLEDGAVTGAPRGVDVVVVPVLNVDGSPLFESNAIAEYLEEAEAPHLHPEDLVKRARNRAWTDFLTTFTGGLSGIYYAKTAEAWLQNTDRNQSKILDLFIKDLPQKEAVQAFHRWRIFFLACAETFALHKGQEWWVSHYLFKKS